MQPSERADLAATGDAIQRLADGIRPGMIWDRRNPYGSNPGRNRSVIGTDLAIKGSRAPLMKITAPRNAPCPCGSGRKYKKCCLLET